MSNQIEGRRPVLEALRAGRAITEVLVADGAKSAGALAEIVRAASKRGIPVRELRRRDLEEMAETRNPQGVIARATRAFKYASLDDVLKSAGKLPLLVALDGVTDPQNLGALARSAEAAGAHALLVGKRRSAPVTAAAEKAAAGALEHLPVVQVANLTRTLEELKDNGVWIVALDSDGDESIYDVPVDSGLCVVIGDEGRGVSRLVREHADHVASIPMSGEVQSLNAAASAAVALFEIKRRRRS